MALFGASGTSTGAGNTAVGYQAGTNNTTGAQNTVVGLAAGYGLTTGSYSTAIGYGTLGYFASAYTTGNYNTALGHSALGNNTTSSNNTAIGYQAGYTNTTGAYNNVFGTQALYTNLSSSRNNAFGYYALNLCTGGNNAAFGDGAGYLMTSGTKNTIIGSYSGNQGGLDIRTASNNIVLSDGDGNPLAYSSTSSNSVNWNVNSNSGGRYSGFGMYIANVYKSQIYWDNTNTNLYVQNASGGVYLTNTGTSWTSNSDERLKENLVPITDALTKVNSLRSVIGNFIADETKKKTPFLIAQDVQSVLPEAVTSSTLKDDETNTEYLGVAYSEVIPLLVAAIKELSAELNALKAKVG